MCGTQPGQPAGRRGCASPPSSLSLIFATPEGFAAQQAPRRKETTHPASQAPSPFADSQELIQQGKFADAKLRIQQELQQNPSNAQGYALLGLVYTAEKNYPEALTAFQQGLKLDPKATGIRNDLGNLYVAQGNLDLAEKEFREVLRINPADDDGNYNLSLVLLTKKHSTEAIPYLLRIHPQTIASRITLTRAYLEAHRTAEASEDGAGTLCTKQRQRAGALHSGRIAGR